MFVVRTVKTITITSLMQLNLLVGLKKNEIFLECEIQNAVNLVRLGAS